MVAASGTVVLTDEFREALGLLAAGRNLFLTGKAGTGKSTLIRHFMANTDRNVVVVAPTGIAALNVDGHTIHRLFGFRPTTTLSDVTGGDFRPGRFTKTIGKLQTLIIDEASMVRADVFDMIAAALQRFGPEPGTAFGGVQVVLVGDLYQLPPVVTEGEQQYFSTTYDTPYFFSANVFSRQDFPSVSLTTVFRQLGDDRMTAILNEIREGVLLGHAKEHLDARVDADFVPPDDEFWLTLAPTNRLVTARNRQQLERLPGEEMVHLATESGDLSLFDKPLEDELRFKVGAQVMMLNNDQAERWVNGSIGRVVGVGYNRHGAVVEVEFPDGDIAEVAPFTWEATRPVVEGGTLRRDVVGTFTQLPFKLAWAITIHKSQGQTLERLVVDLSGGMFSTGQLYVALSRCTSLAGLVLKRPVLPKDLKVDRRIARFLRATANSDRARRFCAIGLLTVGDEGRMSRPRPVELAVAFDDGTAVSTLINPQRDLADARQAYRIGVGDVLLAPTLREAWAVIAPMLAGCTPVGVKVDETLGLIDFELKRLGQVIPMPLGIELRGGHLTGHTALQRARSALERLDTVDLAAGSSPFDDPDVTEALSGILVSRDHDVATPTAEHLPALSALLRISRSLGSILLGTAAAHQGRPAGETSWEQAARRTAADQLLLAAARTRLPQEVLARLRDALEALGVGELGSELAPEASADANIDAVLVPGARICFTGTAVDGHGRVVDRDEMERLAASAGLAPVRSVTKTRCEVLVIAEAGTQSGKARKAQEYGKPVFTVDEFFRWKAGR
ncbi:AAA family ATPase [[Mycobacterium] nativiensis]|uniref:AAA family ATPase n=1 Tax=[Mycobacterium] nativiensis TaxID=2855503 RepID=A0ABU5Y353_9MYCO|nr:AAA family ATPase [Mycolicibacter sp. MYC340]MEB3034553.1 AAA family ATPase [Mycolicibacter sp. MYC340]